MTKLETEAKSITCLRFANSGEQRTAAHQFYEHIGYVSDKNKSDSLNTWILKLCL